METLAITGSVNEDQDIQWTRPYRSPGDTKACSQKHKPGVDNVSLIAQTDSGFRHELTNGTGPSPIE